MLFEVTHLKLDEVGPMEILCEVGAFLCQDLLDGRLLK